MSDTLITKQEEMDLVAEWENEFSQGLVTAESAIFESGPVPETAQSARQLEEDIKESNREMKYQETFPVEANTIDDVISQATFMVDGPIDPSRTRSTSSFTPGDVIQPGPLTEATFDFAKGIEAANVIMTMNTQLYDAIHNYTPEQLEENPSIFDNILKLQKDIPDTLKNREGWRRWPYLTGQGLAFTKPALEGGLFKKTVEGLGSYKGVGEFIKINPRMAWGIGILGTMGYMFKEYVPILTGESLADSLQDKNIRGKVPMKDIIRVAKLVGPINTGIEVALDMTLVRLLPKAVTEPIAKPIRAATKRAMVNYMKKNNIFQALKTLVNTSSGKVATAVGSEIGEEYAQFGVSTVADNYLTELSNELNNTDIPLKDKEYVWKEMKAQFPDLLMSTLSIVGGFKMVGATMDQIGQKLDQKISEKKAKDKKDAYVAWLLKMAEEDERAYQKERTRNADAAPKQNGLVIDEEGNNVKTSETYTANVDDYEAGKKATVTDEEIDNLILSNTDEELGIVAGEIIQNQMGGDELYSDFRLGLREIATEEEADAVESIVTALAKASDRTIEEYLSHHKLSIEAKMDENMGDISGATTFLEDGRTIIRAFHGADVSTMVHELAHVFRKDLSGEHLNTIESWLGVEDGKWTREAEESFANGFELYLQDGKAPSAELETVFAKFARWISEIYRVFRRSDVNIPQEARAVYDSLLTRMDESGNVLQNRAEETLFQKRTNKFEKEIENTLDEGVQVTGDVGTISTFDAFKNKLISHAKAAQEAIAKGDKVAASRENARMKEIIARAAKRRSTTKMRGKLKEKIRKTVNEYAKIKKANKVITQAEVAYFSTLKDITSLSLQETKAAYFEMHDRIADELVGDEKSGEENILTPEDLIRYNLLKMGAFPQQQSTDDLQSLYDDIKEVIKTGKSKRQKQLFAEAKRISDAREQVFKSFGFADGKLPLDLKSEGVDPNERKTFWDRMRLAFNNITGYTIDGWHTTLENMSRNSGHMPGESFMEIFGETIDQENAENVGLMNKNLELLQGFMDAFGFKEGEEGKANRKLYNMGFEVIELPETVRVLKDTVGGEKVDVKQVKAETFTRPQMWQRVMELQHKNPLIQKVLIDTMGYKDEEGNTLLNSQRGKALMGAMKAEDWAMVDALRRMYDSSFHSLNKVYVQQNGVDLAHNEGYVPVSREVQDALGHESEEAFLTGLIQGSLAATTGRIKEITGSLAPLKKRSAVDVMSQYIIETEHYKAWAGKIRDFNSVFLNSDFLTAVKHKYGNAAPGVIREQIHLMAFRSRKGVRNINALDRWRVNMTRTSLAVKPSLTIKQFLSLPGFATEMPFEDFISYTSKFFLNPIQNAKLLKEESDFIKTRVGGNIERDIRDAALQRPVMGESGSKLAKFNLTPRQWNMLMKNIQIGDIAPIYVGIYAVKNYLIDKKQMKPEDALRQAEIVARNTQQSPALSMQSLMQAGNSFEKLFTSFTSATVLYHRKEIGAWKALANGQWVADGDKNSKASRSNKMKLMKQLFIFHYVLPAIYQAVTDLDWDWENQARVALLGSFNNLFLLGEYLGRGASAAFGILAKGVSSLEDKVDFKREVWKDELTSTIPAMQPIDDILDSFEKIQRGKDLTPEDFADALNTMGIIANRPIPVKSLYNMAAGIFDFYNGMETQDNDLIIKGSWRMAGWGEYTATSEKPLTAKQRRAKAKVKRESN